MMCTSSIIQTNSTITATSHFLVIHFLINGRSRTWALPKRYISFSFMSPPAWAVWAYCLHWCCKRAIRAYLSSWYLQLHHFAAVATWDWHAVICADSGQHRGCYWAGGNLHCQILFSGLGLMVQPGGPCIWRSFGYHGAQANQDWLLVCPACFMP